MIIRTIFCSGRNCKERYTEKEENDGFPHWGHIGGIADDKTGETPHLCPKCLQSIVLNFLEKRD